MNNMVKESTEEETAVKPESGKAMPFTGHLEELRQAVIISVVSIVITTGLCFYFNRELISLLTAPLTNNIKNIQLIFVSPGEAFVATIRMALITGIIMALPVILNRLYWFVSPGLTKEEKRVSLPILTMAYLLFLSGVAFSYYALLPFGVKFLVEFAPADISPMISIGSYISFASSVILGTGLIFELPLVLLFLAFINIVSSALLKKSRRYAFLISFIIGAVITPSIDVLTQSILAGALYILYEFSIILIKMLEIRRKKAVVNYE